MGRLKLLHVKGRHGSSQLEIGLGLREGSGFAIAVYRGPEGHRAPVGPGEKRRKAAAKALPPVEETQPRTIILKRGLKALAQGVLEQAFGGVPFHVLALSPWRDGDPDSR
jgi:hypothetical protein